MHRRAREHRYAASVREVPHGRRLRGGRPQSVGTRDSVHWLLSEQDQVDHRNDAGARRATWRRSAANNGRADRLTRRGSKDGQRDPRHLVPEERRGGRRHARAAAHPPTGSHPAGRPGEDRARVDGDRAAGRLDLVLAHPDSPRPRRLYRATTTLRRLRAESALPQLAGMSTLSPIDRAGLIATRRDIHQNPELGFEETRTANLITDRLRGLNYQVTPGIGKTGVVGLKKNAGRCVLLRADMDALPVDEANAVPYRSKQPGKMHACGHDGHVAIGLEVARRLAPLELPGSVKFAFQPAEEASNGAQAMIKDGVLEKPRVDAAFGIHLWNDLPVGTVGVMAGPVMASVDQFEIAILGRGGHAAAPHQTIDPVLVAAHVITALQSLVSRRRDPLSEAVVSVTEVHAGRAFNVIPDRADLRGTVRTFGGHFFEDAPRLIEETAQGVASAFGARANVNYRRLSAPLINNEELSALMRDVAAGLIGAGNVRQGVRTMGGEDMSYFLASVPGCFAFVGSAPTGGRASPHHSPTFDIDEESLVIGAELLTQTAIRYLD